MKHDDLAIQAWETAFRSKVEEAALSGKQASQGPGESLTRRNSEVVRRFFEALEDLKNELLDGRVSFADVWHKSRFILKSPHWTKVSQASEAKTDILPSVFREILLTVVRRRRVVLRDGAVLAPKDVLSFYSKEGVLKAWWHDILWIQLSHLAEVRAMKTAPRDKLEEQVLLQEVLKTWDELVRYWHANAERNQRVISTRQDSASPHALGNIATAQDQHDRWKYLPKIPRSEEWLKKLPSQLSSRVPILLGIRGIYRGIQEVGSAALMTLHYWHDLHETSVADGGYSFEDESFFNRLRMLSQNVEWDCPKLEKSLSLVGTSSKLIEAAKEDCARSPVSAIALSVARTETVSQSGRASSKRPPTLNWSEHEVKQFFNHTNKLREKSDAIAATKLWDKTKFRITKHSPHDEQLRSTIFARFLRLFFEVRQSATAIDVWNYMILIGHEPGLRHWNAMLSGCSYIRDAVSLQSIWSNLQRAKIQPDNELWTTYIHGLIKANRPQQGLSLLEELGKEWKRPRTAIKPDLGPVHGALSAFQELNWGRESIVGMHATILQWARSQSLTLTVHTYNILLATVVRKSNTSEISGHLAAMAADNCAPDAYTYTIILQGLLATPESPFHHLTQADQSDYIQSVLAEMEAKSIRPTPHTYSTIVFALLNNQQKAAPNVSAAHVVLAHMDKTGVQPSQHIYTILITHYFSLSPPDLLAVESLLTSILRGVPSSPKSATGRLNNYFWNRVIMGYANCDEWEKSLYYLRKLPSEARSPYWTGLQRLLQALGRADEWELCAQVVEGVERGETMKWADSDIDNRRGSLGWEGFNSEVEALKLRGLIPNAEGDVVRPA
ncbi:MAG: hypothetical protein OHK93_006963 [Ramalina farinacea]|uniref:Uncharacterized protein n=1 Tax=Ramalina farinacea TaxID=258253 RepID=A0AA43QJK9_9LECA|nr:hypothetical protein [Ramalina farinacea]